VRVALPAEATGGTVVPMDDAAVAVEVVTPREVPLGGPRAMTVRRTLPQKQRSLIGAWCFVDHYGPDDVVDTGGMLVPPHPHTGLQTVTWLFTGEVEHRDSGGVRALVRPGAVNLMTAGDGIAHSEVSTPATTTLHGVQLWVALPAVARDAPRAFHHHEPTPVDVDGSAVRVFLGALAGAVSPVPTHTPLVGAEVVLPPGARVVLDVDPTYEHGLLVDSGSVALCGTPLVRGELGYTGVGEQRLVVEDLGGTGARFLLLGGTPFGEEIVMWWNFVARSHEEVVDMREQWNARSARFGDVEGFVGDPSRLPAPALPHVRLMPRHNAPSSVIA